MDIIITICDLSILDTINANGPHYTHLRCRYTCDDNRKRFAIIVAFAVYVPHWNLRYFICEYVAFALMVFAVLVGHLCGYGIFPFSADLITQSFAILVVQLR